MVQLATSQDSAATQLSFALEDSYGVLPGSPVWYIFEPNEFDDTGIEIETAPRVTINGSGQREKGEIVSLDAGIGMTADLTQNNFKPFMPGLLSAPLVSTAEQVVTAVDIDAGNPDEYEVADTTGFLVGHLVKGFGFAQSANNGVARVTVVTSNTSVEVVTGSLVDETPPADAYIKVVGYSAQTGDIDVTTTGDFATYTSTTLDFTTLGLTPGQWIFVGGDIAGHKFTNATNNGFKRIRSIAANALVVDMSLDGAMVTEANTTSDIRIFFGDYIKNVAVTSRVKQYVQWELQLGAPDEDNPSQIQSQYLIGTDLNVFGITAPLEDKAGTSYEFIASDEETRTGATGVKSGTRASYTSEEAYNTASDEVAVNLVLKPTTSEVVTSVAASISEWELSIDMGKEPLKRQAQLAAFKTGQGSLEVSVDLTFYFTDVTALGYARTNADMAFHAIFAKDNAGFAIDMPMGGIDAAPLDYSDVAIMQSTTFNASRGRRYLSTMDHTTLFTWFGYLPDAAMPS